MKYPDHLLRQLRGSCTSPSQCPMIRSVPWGAQRPGIILAWVRVFPPPEMLYPRCVPGPQNSCSWKSQFKCSFLVELLSTLYKSSIYSTLSDKKASFMFSDSQPKNFLVCVGRKKFPLPLKVLLAGLRI